ncbi:hypothetical protein [Streptomyces cyaneofuscatus]|uniref:hypothetical protein n=1 Tax=Streptomyces cyaneofuscatus TaxID=66883 RepID=UPI0037A3404D
MALVLQKGTRFTERSRYTELVAALDAPEWDEELTYFWCHGAFAPGGPELPHLAIRLSDDTLIDGHTIRSYRAPYQRRGFHTFVLLNACHGATAGECDWSFLSRVLIESGAQGCHRDQGPSPGRTPRRTQPVHLRQEPHQRNESPRHH